MAKLDDLKTAVAVAQANLDAANAALTAYHKQVVKATLTAIAPNQNAVYVQMGDDSVQEWQIDDPSAKALISGFSAWTPYAAPAAPVSTP